MQEGHVHTSTNENGIAHIEFYSPAGNSLPGHLLQSLSQAISKAGHDEAVKVIVLKSAGERTFCAGASFDELLAIEDLNQGKAFFSGFANVINAIRTIPKLVIGRVQGKAVGGGVGLASAVDYCMATEAASIKLSELAVGIGPFVVGPAVERKIGRSAMSSLAINATTWQSAQWAYERGLYAGLYPDIEAMDEAINSLSITLAQSNPQAMSELKRIFWEGCEHWDSLLAERAAVSGTLVLSDFTRQFIAEFKEGMRK